MDAANAISGVVEQAVPSADPCADAAERLRARRYPIARWYLRPAADRLAIALVPTRVRPMHLTLCGLAAAMAATGLLVWRPEAAPVAAVLTLAWWFFDRADGQLARRQGTVSRLGAWLDGNVDELVDVGVHGAMAAVLADQLAASWPWIVLGAFLAGKYLMMYGLALEEHVAKPALKEDETSRPAGWLRSLYHLPGNADIRAHLMVAALATGLLAAELVLVAVYYNLRWIVRYVLVARRLGGVR